MAKDPSVLALTQGMGKEANSQIYLYLIFTESCFLCDRGEYQALDEELKFGRQYNLATNYKITFHSQGKEE